ncbi:3'-5' exonuclease, partial [[Ruminococcus] torques]
MKYTADLKNESAVETDFPYALVKMETLPYLVNKDLKRNAMLSEEMRVLYVAFTRAKKKLYMVGKIKQKELEKY